MESAPLISRTLTGLLVPIPTDTPVSAPFIQAIEPRIMVFDCVTSAFAPMAEAFERFPVDVVARYPRKEFHVPVIIPAFPRYDVPAKYPRAVFPVPVEFVRRASTQMAVFHEPIVLE